MDVGILGQQIFTIPYIGHIAAFVKTPIGFGLIIVLPAILFIISQIVNIKKYINEEIDKQVKSKTLPILFFLLSFLTVLSLLFTGSILAKLHSTTTVSNITFSIKDFVPPSIPTNLHWSNPNILCGGHTNSYTVIGDWNNSTDDAGVLKYEYEITYPKISGGIGVWKTFITNSQYSGVFNQAQGEHTYRVRAYDINNNISNWSASCSVTYDKTPPVSTLEEFPYNYNQNILTIGYSTTDNFEVDHTDLCYTFNDEVTENCTSNFNFDFPRGQGTYYFYSRATDKAGNVEVPTINPTNATIYDYTPPTTNLNLNTSIPSFSGQNLISGIGVSFYLDNFSQQIFLPQNLSSNLTFSFKYYSEDYPEYANLNVGVSTTNGFFDILNFGEKGDFDWQTISHSLLQWSGQTVDIIFKLTRLDPSYLTTTILKDINISPLDLRTGDTTPSEFLATDLGTGVFDSTTIPATVSSTDMALNIEATHSISIVTLPPVVLNKITSSIITLYNNTDSSINLSTYIIDIGTTTILSGTIPSFSTLDIPVSVGTTQVGLLKDSAVVDFTTFEALGTATWQRQSNGLGPWVRINAPLSFDLQPRKLESKVTFTASGIGDTSIDLSYIINYNDQQIAGSIAPHTVDSIGTASRDFYLGTCSGDVCIPATMGIGSTITVKFSTLSAKSFLYK
jgi:hypothetical protein